MGVLTSSTIISLSAHIALFAAISHHLVLHAIRPLVGVISSIVLYPAHSGIIIIILFIDFIRKWGLVKSEKGKPIAFP